MNYSGFNSGRRRKSKLLKTVAIIAALFLVGIYVIGLTLGAESENRVAISEAIEENARLKQELTEKDKRINELSARIEELENPAPEEETPVPEEEGLRQGSPRE